VVLSRTLRAESVSGTRGRVPVVPAGAGPVCCWATGGAGSGVGAV